ncbi:MAG: hypothetical protein FWF81_11930 [Defluviitaleaceae bacterium]|nr:hypothetical protein [Defluviitaleaceae bacterium]
MEQTKNLCLCPNTRCKRHNNCEACRANHRGKKMYCELKDGTFRKWLIDKLFGKSKKS